MTSARSAGLICGQGPLSNASRAAATARSTSAVVASGTLAMTSSVWGEITASWSEPAGSTQSPPMKNLSWFTFSPQIASVEP